MGPYLNKQTSWWAPFFLRPRLGSAWVELDEEVQTLAYDRPVSEAKEINDLWDGCFNWIVNHEGKNTSCGVCSPTSQPASSTSRRRVDGVTADSAEASNTTGHGVSLYVNP